MLSLLDFVNLLHQHLHKQCLDQVEGHIYIIYILRLLVLVAKEPRNTPVLGGYSWK